MVQMSGLAALFGRGRGGRATRFRIDRVEQGAHLLPGGDMGHRQGRAILDRLEIQQCQPLQEKFAKDDPFAKSRGEPKADTARQGLQQLAHVALVTCLGMAEAIAHDDPVDTAAIAGIARLALFPYCFGIEACAADASGLRIDPRKKIKVDQAVIDRRDQKIGLRMGITAGRSIGAGRIDNDEIGAGGGIDQRIPDRVDGALGDGLVGAAMQALSRERAALSLENCGSAGLRRERRRVRFER